MSAGKPVSLLEKTTTTQKEESPLTKWLRPAAESWPGRFLSNILRRYFIHDVGRQGAALAYYLLFTLFPFLIFLSSLLGLLDLDISGIMGSLSPLLPASVLELIETYLTYVARTSSPAMLWSNAGILS